MLEHLIKDAHIFPKTPKFCNVVSNDLRNNAFSFFVSISDRKYIHENIPKPQDHFKEGIYIEMKLSQKENLLPFLLNGQSCLILCIKYTKKLSDFKEGVGGGFYIISGTTNKFF